MQSNRQRFSRINMTSDFLLLRSDPVFVIMEYVSGGKLQSFLRKSRADHYYGNLHGSSSHLSSRDLTSFAFQVARAMDYLTSKDVNSNHIASPS